MPIYHEMHSRSNDFLYLLHLTCDTKRSMFCAISAGFSTIRKDTFPREKNVNTKTFFAKIYKTGEIIRPKRHARHIYQVEA